MTLKTALNWRYATKKFDTKKLPQAKIDELLESLRMAPSSFGLQPWKFLVVDDPKIRESLVPVSWGQAQIKDASHLIVLCARTDVDERFVKGFIASTAKARGIPAESLKGYHDMIMGSVKKLTKEQLDIWSAKQVYIALGFLLLAAAELGVDACPMEGFDPVAVNKILKLPEQNLNVVAMCPIGYRAADDKYASLAKVRSDAKDVIKHI